MNYQEMKHKRLICIQTSMDTKVYLVMVRVVTKSQKVNVSDISEVGL